MIDLLRTLGANRRDCIWFFILTSLFFGYAYTMGVGGQFILDNMPLSIARDVTVVTIEFMAVISGLIGIILVICGLSVLITGGSSEL